jgi:hypothetical protein
LTAQYTRSIGYNLTFGVDFTGGTSYTTLGHIVDIGGNDAKTDMADTTLLADQFYSWLPASTNGGSFKMSIGWDPNDTGTGSVYGQLALAQKSGTLCGCQITVTYDPVGSPTTGTETFKAYVEGLSRKFGKKNLNMVEVELRIVGDPGMAAE